MKPFDPVGCRADFPLLARRVHGKRLVYLDNAATTQKPQVVIDRVTRYYAAENANVHRGAYWLSERATAAYEHARARMAQFLNAADPREIVFVRGTTEAINLVAHSFGRLRVGRGDEVIVSEMEHHSNIVPWHLLCEATGARLRVARVTDAGEIDLERYADLLSRRTRIVAIAHVSNALGSVNPVRRIVSEAHRRDIPVLVDGAQAVSHGPVDVQALGCDFYACSGHKLFGPTGIGVLYGRDRWFEAMPPYQGGGDMIASVAFDRIAYQPPPHRFEAGTPHIAGAVGLAAAVDYLGDIGLERIARHEQNLVAAAIDAISSVAGVRLVGAPAERAGILSFVVDDIHPHDVATILDREGIAIRAGHHCCQPLMDRLGVTATARVSFAPYNGVDDVEALAAALDTVRRVFE